MAYPVDRLRSARHIERDRTGSSSVRVAREDRAVGTRGACRAAAQFKIQDLTPAPDPRTSTRHVSGPRPRVCGSIWNTRYRLADR